MLIKQGGQLIQDNLNLSQQLVNQILNIAVNLAQCILERIKYGGKLLHGVIQLVDTAGRLTYPCNILFEAVCEGLAPLGQLRAAADQCGTTC